MKRVYLEPIVQYAELDEKDAVLTESIDLDWNSLWNSGWDGSQDY